MKSAFFAATLAVLGLAAPASAVPVQWTGTPGATGNYYELITSNIGWGAANAAASASTFMGATGHLVTITSAAEQAFLATLNPGNVATWIGATDQAVEGTWEWVTGEDFTYTNWATGQPNNILGQDFGLAFWNTAGEWNDCGTISFLCSAGGYFVEYTVAAVPLPASVSLMGLGLGALGLMGWRRKAKRNLAAA